MGQGATNRPIPSTAKSMIMTDDIDLREEIDLRECHPKPNRLETIDPEQAVVTFDRRSDTLLIHLFS